MEKSPSAKEILLIALGGNALIRKGQTGAIGEQFANLRLPVRQIAGLVDDYRIIITFGNGPQVGNLLLQQDCCDAVPKLPLEILVAQTQGQIGYMIESTLDNELMLRGRAGISSVCSATLLSTVTTRLLPGPPSPSARFTAGKKRPRFLSRPLPPPRGIAGWWHRPGQGPLSKKGR
jgi:hypothetical protein